MTRLAAVTGANRGIGLSICKHLKARGYNVIGTCRTKTPEMEALKLEIVEGGFFQLAGRGTAYFCRDIYIHHSIILSVFGI